VDEQIEREREREREGERERERERERAKGVATFQSASRDNAHAQDFIRIACDCEELSRIDISS